MDQITKLVRYLLLRGAPPMQTPGKNVLQRASEVEKTYRITDGLYVIGSLERGATVYKQQVRAHNLAWAIWELQQAKKMPEINTIAIVGGGIAGLTAAGCFLSLFEDTKITVFEQLWDLCPLQQGADNRWLHPRIYDWPMPGSRAPGASLPVLNWSEGRASDVARTVLSEFDQVVNEFDPSGERLRVYVGLGHLRITASKKNIDWIGNRATNDDSFFRMGSSEGKSEAFDVIAVACGFGLESKAPDYPTASYWRNEQIGQPILDGSRQTFLISGYGDGALTDLFRLTIERFRQDTILYEIFDNLDEVEAYFANAWPEEKWRESALALFEASEAKWLAVAATRLSKRIRKDTQVVLHVQGKDGNPKSFAHVYGPHSSFLSRLLTYLLYRCGAFAISLDDLPLAIHAHGIPRSNVLCRYGADAIGHLRRLFVDGDSFDKRLIQLKESQPQKPRLAWEPGIFPITK